MPTKGLSVLVTAVPAIVFMLSPRVASAQTCQPSTVVDGVNLNPDGDGLDTSEWTSAAESGVAFAIVKATQGTSYIDSDFPTNWAALKSAGVIRGAYHFFDPTVSGVNQANYFLAEMGTLEATDLPPTLDIECPTSNDEPDSDNCLGNGTSGDATGAQITQYMNEWLTTVAAATGRTPIVYSYGSYFSGDGIDTTGLENYPLWLADYSDNNCYTVPTPWTNATFWQYSDSGDVSGLGSGTDTDYFLGSMSQLTTFIGGAGDSGVHEVDGGGDASTSGSATPPSQANGNDAVSLVNWPSGQIELYLTTSDGAAMRIETVLSTTTPEDTWGSPVKLGGGASCGVASAFITESGAATVDIFDGLTNGTTEELTYDTSDPQWPSFAPFGGVGLNHLSTLTYPNGRVEVLALADDGGIWHKVSPSSLGGAWSAWGVLAQGASSFVTGAAPIVWPDGHAEAFATDASGSAWHAKTGVPTGGAAPTWSAWASLGGSIASRPMPALWADGHVQLFARGTDGHLYTSDSSGGTFGAFSALNPSQTILGEPSVLVYADYGPEIFSRDAAGDVIHMWNGSGTWSAWANDLGQVITSDPMAWLRPDGLAEVFGVDASGELRKSLHNGATWSSWTTIATGVGACVGGTKLVDAGVPTGTTLDGGLTPPPNSHDAGSGGAGAGGGGGGGEVAPAPSSSGCAVTKGGTEERGLDGLFVLFALGTLVVKRRR